MTKREAVRVVKRRFSDAIYRQLILDAERVGLGGAGGAGGAGGRGGLINPT